MDIDAKDLGILAQLRNDCHISQVELGERVDLSTTAVSARVARLEKDKYITGYNTFIDYGKLGYLSSALLSIKVKNTSSLNPQSLAEIIAMPEVMNLFAMTGNHHLNLFIKARSMAELRDRIAAVGKNKHVYEMTTEYVVEEYKEFEEFNPLMNGAKRPSKKYENIKPPDDLDLAILREMRTNANIILRELSTKLKTPISTVKERIARLERGGVIRGYVADINFPKIGYSEYGFISLRLESDQLDNPEIVRRLKESPEIGSLFRVLGSHDLCAGMVVKNANNSLEAVRALSSISGIRDVEPNTAFLNLKSKSDFNPLRGFKMEREKE
jgi:Lrp/AsnC family leucine-responsive transcriptional regulator